MGELNNAAHHFELSVLVIAATLSIVDAGWCQPGGLESAPERPATVRLAFWPEGRDLGQKSAKEKAPAETTQ